MMPPMQNDRTLGRPSESSSKSIRIGSIPAYNLAVTHLKHAVVAALSVKICLQIAPPPHVFSARATNDQCVRIDILRKREVDRFALWTFQFAIEMLTHIVTHEGILPSFAATLFWQPTFPDWWLRVQ
jgi:hypothetical protein